VCSASNPCWGRNWPDLGVAYFSSVPPVSSWGGNLNMPRPFSSTSFPIYSSVSSTHATWDVLVTDSDVALQTYRNDFVASTTALSAGIEQSDREAVSRFHTPLGHCTKNNCHAIAAFLRVKQVDLKTQILSSIKLIFQEAAIYVCLRDKLHARMFLSRHRITFSTHTHAHARTHARARTVCIWCSAEE
jgi:hypothetical protein